MATEIEIIVTDLTRFSNKELLCMAGLTFDGQTCIRPLRDSSPGYLTYARCKEKLVLPGTVLRGKFRQYHAIGTSHPEDRVFNSLSYVRQSSSEEFERVLESSAFTNVEEGFGVEVNDKVINSMPVRSIFTLKIEPENFEIIQDGFQPNKIRATFTDGNAKRFAFLSVTDLGFFDFVGNTDTKKVSIREINRFIHSQDRLYLRVGLSRTHSSQDGRSGLWMQVNGIYTFPNFEHVLREY
jgi:hypothetical protein